GGREGPLVLAGPLGGPDTGQFRRERQGGDRGPGEIPLRLDRHLDGGQLVLGSARAFRPGDVGGGPLDGDGDRPAVGLPLPVLVPDRGAVFVEQPQGEREVVAGQFGPGRRGLGRRGRGGPGGRWGRRGGRDGGGRRRGRRGRLGQPDADPLPFRDVHLRLRGNLAAAEIDDERLGPLQRVVRVEVELARLVRADRQVGGRL